MKSLIISVLLIGIFVVVLSGVGSAVECNADLSNVQTNGNMFCTISNSLTFNSTFTKDLSAYAIRGIGINGNNIVLDCNYSTIYGNYTNLSDGSGGIAGITVGYNMVNNVTIKNCNIRNFNYELYFYNNTNITVQDSIFENGVYPILIANNLNDPSRYITFNNITVRNSSNAKFGLIYVTNSHHIIVNNSKLENAGTYAFQGFNSSYITLSNNIFNGTNSSSSGIITFDANNGDTGTHDILVLNNILESESNFPVISMDDIYDSVFKDNLCLGGRCFSGSVRSRNIVLDNLIMLKPNNAIAAGISTSGMYNSLIRNIVISQLNQTVSINSGSYNVTVRDSIFANNTGVFSNQLEANGNSGGLGAVNEIYFINNTLWGSDIGINVLNATNVYLYNNTIYDLFKYYDGWGVGILADRYVYNLTLIGNNLTYPNSGVIFRKSNGLIIGQNYFNEESIANKILKRAINYREIQSAIGLYEIFETWTGDALEVGTWNRTNAISNYSSSNINIYNNTFSDNVHVKLLTQGTTNLTQDLSNYWYRSFQSPIYFIDKTEIWVNNNKDNITMCGVGNGLSGCYTGLAQGFMGAPTPRFMNYSFYKTYSYYKNVNLTQTYTSSVFNLTSPRIYNATLSSGTIITNNEANLTLQPNKEVYISDGAWV